MKDNLDCYSSPKELQIERIRGRPYCLQGGHGSLKITVNKIA